MVWMKLFHKNLQKVHAENHVFTEDKEYIKPEVYAAYKAFDQAESITIDPHKMGYVPYSAGGIVIQDIRMRDTISYFATYVFRISSYLPLAFRLASPALNFSTSSGCAAFMVANP